MNWECIRLSKKINDQNPVITLDMKFVYVSDETPEKVSRNINRHVDNRISKHGIELQNGHKINIFSNCIHVYFFFVSV